MSTERKWLIAAAVASVLIMSAALIVLGFLVHPIAGVAAIVCVAQWIGSSIAAVLEDSKIAGLEKAKAHAAASATAAPVTARSASERGATG